MPKCMNCQFCAHVKKYKRCSDSSLYKTIKNQIEIFEIGFYAKKYVLPIWRHSNSFLVGSRYLLTESSWVYMTWLSLLSFFFVRNLENTDNQKGNVFFVETETAVMRFQSQWDEIISKRAFYYKITLDSGIKGYEYRPTRPFNMQPLF